MSARLKLLLVIAIFLVPSVSAQVQSTYPYLSPSTLNSAVDYNGGGSVVWGCTSEGNDGTQICPEATLEDMPGYNMKVYNDNGEHFLTVYEYNFNNKWSDKWGYEFNLDLPENNFDYGRLNVELWTEGGNPEKIDDGTIFVNGTTENPNQAPYLYLKMDTDPSPHQLKMFALSDDEWSRTSDDISLGSLMVEEEDGEDDAWPGASHHQCVYLPADDDTGVVGASFLDQGWSWPPVVDGELGCSEDAQSVLEQDFGQNIQQRIGVSYSGAYGLETVSPVHKNGDFIVNGELARAYEPNIPDNPELNGQGPYWYICREGAQYPRSSGSGGNVISLQSEEGGQLLRCDAEGNETGYRDDTKNDWEEVTECQDGLDNDGDGNVDLEDPGCGGNPETEIEGDVECKPVVGIVEGEKKAFYSPDPDGVLSPDGSDCNYQLVDEAPEYSRQEAERFACEESPQAPGGVAVINYDGPTPNAADNFCRDRLNAEGNFAHNPMPVAQYFIPESGIPTGEEWATENGYKTNYRFQTLHQAEEKYGGGSPHSESTWEDKNMQGISGYENGDVEDFGDAWQVANATGRQSEDVGDSLGPINRSDVFEGGFHGECEPGHDWVYSMGRWICDVGSAEESTLTINSYILDGNPGGELAGFRVNWSEIKKWQVAHPSLPPEGNDNGVGPVEINAMCWHGGNQERPQDLSEVVNLSVEIEEGKDTAVVGKLPERSTTPSNPGSYACVFGLTQALNKIQNNDIEYASTTQLYYQGSKGPEETALGWKGFVTEGTNAHGNLNIKDEMFRPSRNMQEWLKENQTAETEGFLWPNFRAEEDLTDIAGVEECEQIRHPLNFKEAGCAE